MGLDGRTNRRSISEREPTDFLSRNHVAIKQHWRHREDVSDVVESIARFVRWQQRALVDLQRQKIANRVAILDPVQPMDGWTAGIRACR